MANCLSEGELMTKSLRITKADFDMIRAQSREEYGTGECCGVFTWRPGESAVIVHKCQNIQNSMHAREPERYPRTNLNAYLIDPEELHGIISDAENEGGGIAGIYHSHVDCDAYFSSEDKEQACAFFDNEPMFPDAVYLVVSVFGNRSGNLEPTIAGHKCFAWDEDVRDFVEADLSVV